MELVFKNHPSDDLIELYALGKLAEELVPSFEEHLLICCQCQDALQVEDTLSQGIPELKRNRGGIRLM
jgi:hypothetical protein